MSQKIANFITIAVRTSNPTTYKLFPKYSEVSIICRNGMEK
jgi:hypothetical protein